jgi:hypothetical protein
MLRDQLFQWRKMHSVPKDSNTENYQEYLDAVNELPESDRECAAALWGIRDEHDILVIISAFHHLDAWRETSK